MASRASIEIMDDAPVQAAEAVEARPVDRDRERQIVKAAYELLDEEGLEGLTIRAVLKRTGLSRRAFYERFDGKDDLVLAVFEQTLQFAAELYSREVGPIADPMRRLELIITSIVLGRAGPEDEHASYSDRRGAALSREHLRLAESRPDDLQAALRPLIDLITQHLSDGQAAGQVREGSPKQLAALVYNLVSTTVHTQLLAEERVQPDRERREQLARELWEFCRRALAA